METGAFVRFKRNALLQQQNGEPQSLPLVGIGWLFHPVDGRLDVSDGNL